MSFDEIISKYGIEDICPEIDNELNGFFTDLIGDDFEMGIFPEGSADDESKFLVTVEITKKKAKLNSDQVAQIKENVTERLFHMLGNDAGKVKKYFEGVQIFLNDKPVS
jgi:hypothetical protein